MNEYNLVRHCRHQSGNGKTRAPLTGSKKAKRWEVENELASLAIIECRMRTY